MGSVHSIPGSVNCYCAVKQAATNINIRARFLRSLAAERAKASEAEDDDKDNDQPGAVICPVKRTNSVAHT
jgi:hypothetical protein